MNTLIRRFREESDCIICQTELKHYATKILMCEHAFHDGCLESWMEYNSSCPICRTEIKTEKKHSKEKIKFEPSQEIIGDMACPKCKKLKERHYVLSCGCMHCIKCTNKMDKCFTCGIDISESDKESESDSDSNSDSDSDSNSNWESCSGCEACQSENSESDSESDSESESESDSD